MTSSHRSFFKLTVAELMICACLTGSPVHGQTDRSTLVESVRNLGSQFQENEVGATGFDGATSTPLPGGSALWMFGDTIEGPFKSIRGLSLADKLSNSAAIVPSQDASQGIRNFHFLAQPVAKKPRQLVPFTPDENPAVHRVWPMHGVCIGEYIYLFYHRISLIEGVDVFDNFKLDGMGIARAKTSDLVFERLKAPDGTYEFWKSDQPTFGVYVEQRDDYVYLWGSLMTGMFLARTRPGTIAELDSYEYLIAAPTASNPDVKPHWSKKFEPTASLFDSVPNEMSAAYNAHLGKYIAVHTLLTDNKIVVRTAPQITGPWSDVQVVYRPEREQEKDNFYAAKEHPELARENGKIMYITFVDTVNYVPQLIELTLK
jgi:Domain of unknown function (DUF4185)